MKADAYTAAAHTKVRESANELLNIAGTLSAVAHDIDDPAITTYRHIIFQLGLGLHAIGDEAMKNGVIIETPGG